MLAVFYVVVLIAAAVALAWLGEGWWVTAVALYVPRLAFAAPLPVLVLLLLALRLRRYLWTQVVATVVVVFPLMGFVVPWPKSTDEGAPVLRVLSFNVNSGYEGPAAVAAQIAALSPDVVLLQEALFPGPFVEAMKARYPHVANSSQFVVASRFPILSTTNPAHVSHNGRERSPRFVQYRIQTPLGPIAFYNVHPISPRGVLNLHRVRGAFHLLRTGELFAGDPEGDVDDNAGLRGLQIETIARLAALEPGDVIIAGDTNLPGLSRILRKLSNYRDGFAEAGWGFGYTFPSNRAWLRLDRILASSALRFVSFAVGCPEVSDHRCVVADLQRR